MTDLAADLIALRRAIHKDPEIGLDLPRTQRRILDAIEPLGLEIHLGHGLSSVVAILRGTAPITGPRAAVLLRGDMDALPVQRHRIAGTAARRPSRRTGR